MADQEFVIPEAGPNTPENRTDIRQPAASSQPSAPLVSEAGPVPETPPVPGASGPAPAEVPAQVAQASGATAVSAPDAADLANASRAKGRAFELRVRARYGNVQEWEARGRYDDADAAVAARAAYPADLYEADVVGVAAGD